MQTYPITDAAGIMFALEVENAFIRPRKIADLLRDVAGVTSIRLRKPFSSPADVHLSFGFHGKPFMVWEPFGDNSRYWVGPSDTQSEKVDVSAINEALRQYSPSPVARVIGNLLTLRFIPFKASR